LHSKLSHRLLNDFPRFSFQYLFVITIILFPYLNLFGFFYPIEVIGINLYLVTLFLFILLAFLSNLSKVRNYNEILSIYIYLVIIAIFLGLRLLVYNEPLDTLSALRTPVIFLILWNVAYSFVYISGKVELVYKIIIGNSFIQALIGIIHHYYFPFIVIGGIAGREEGYLINYSYGAFRENGILLNPNLYANFIIIGLFLILYNNKKKTFNIRWQLEILLIIVMEWGIILSSSRYPMFVSFLLIGYYLVKNFSVKSFLVLSIPLLIVVYLQFSSILYSIQRLLIHGYKVRELKNDLARSMIFGDVYSFLIGVPSNIVASSTTIGGLYVSDNSFYMIIMGFGFPAFLIMFYFIYLLVKKSFKGLKIYLFYFIGVLWLTNGVLWEVWLLYFFLSIHIIQKSKNESNQLSP